MGNEKMEAAFPHIVEGREPELLGTQSVKPSEGNVRRFQILTFSSLRCSSGIHPSSVSKEWREMPSRRRVFSSACIRATKEE